MEKNNNDNGVTAKAIEKILNNNFKVNSFKPQIATKYEIEFFKYNSLTDIQSHPQ